MFAYCLPYIPIIHAIRLKQLVHQQQHIIRLLIDLYIVIYSINSINYGGRVRVVGDDVHIIGCIIR